MSRPTQYIIENTQLCLKYLNSSYSMTNILVEKCKPGLVCTSNFWVEKLPATRLSDSPIYDFQNVEVNEQCYYLFIIRINQDKELILLFGFSLYLITWNIAEQMPPADLDLTELLSLNKKKDHLPDLYIIGYVNL